MGLGTTLAGIGSWLASNPQVVTGALSAVGSVAGALSGKGLSGYFGQTSTGSSTQEGGGTSTGGGHSESGSVGGSNDEQIAQWLSQAYQYQDAATDKQGKYNWKTMLTQMGYNTLSAIQQGVYNHIENNVAMQYNSAEALANRNWQEEMSNTAYQRAVKDMEAAGLNPILAYSNGPASTPAGSSGTISGASMGMSSTSAASLGAQSGFVPSSYSTKSWSSSDWYNFSEQFSRASSEQHSSPTELAYNLNKIKEAGDIFNRKVEKETKAADPKNSYQNRNNSQTGQGYNKKSYKPGQNPYTGG